MTLERFLIEVTRFAILLMMAAIGVGSIQLSNILNRRIRPLSEILARQHQNVISEELSHDLEICKSRYIRYLRFRCYWPMAVASANKDLSQRSAGSLIRQRGPSG